MTPAEWIIVIGMAIEGIIGLLGYVQLRQQSRDNKPTRDSQASENIAQAASALIKPLQDRLDKLEDENNLLRNWAERLCKQVITLGGVPVPMIAGSQNRRGMA
jgi:hypothetical protein